MKMVKYTHPRVPGAGRRGDRADPARRARAPRTLRCEPQHAACHIHRTQHTTIQHVFLAQI